MKLLLFALFNLIVTIVIIVSTSTTDQSGSPGKGDMADAAEAASPLEHQRPPDQTFLTFPEWFLVYSPEEYATFIKDNPADRFPFFGHIGEFWQAYKAVYGYIKNKYPFNTGYHVMVMVIGVSTTVEYALRACYEYTIGRLARLTARNKPCDEDRYAAAVAQDYVDFIKVLPWYEYDFLEKLKKLWSENPAVGPNMIRKWERRYILSSEYGAKALYGLLIKKLTKASYDEALLVTSVWVDKLPQIDKQLFSQITQIKTFPDQSALLLIPRYDAFKDYALMLAKGGAHFKEIAGNSDVIMLTYIVPSNWTTQSEDLKVLFTQPILTQPGRMRLAVVVPIKSLSQFLLDFDQPDFKLEHIYDF